MTVNLMVGTGTIINRIPFQASRVVVDMGLATILSRIPTGAIQPVPFWGDDPLSWESIWINGKALPGLAFISGQVAIRVGRRKVAGKHGDSRVQYGYEAAKLSIHMSLWTKEQLDEWNEQLQRLRPRAARGQPGAVTISHPATTMLGINYVEVIRVGLLQLDEPGMDIYSTQLDLLEHIPQPTANKGKVQVPSITTIPVAIPVGTTRKTAPSPTSATAVKPSQTNGGP